MNKRIMVLDDDEDILEIITYLLIEENYEVYSRNNALNLLEDIRNFQPNLLLMDVLLGEQNGMELCSMLKQQDETRKLPVILISGTHNLSDSLSCYGAPNDFLAKPFDVAALLQKVEKCLHS